MDRNSNATPNAGRGSRVFVIVVLALLAAMILAAVIVPFAVYRSRGEVIVSYGQVTVRRDLYVYWLSAYKNYYLKGHPDAEDVPEYWNAADDGILRKDAVRAEADSWIKRIVCAAGFFEEDEYLSLGSATLDAMEKTYARLLQYDLNTEKKYNAAAKKIGFTYATVRRALLYETEGEMYVAGAEDADLQAFFALAEREVTIRDAAKKIDFVSLPTDSRLYLPSGTT